MKTTNRRTFIKNTTLAAGGLTFGAGLAKCAGAGNPALLKKNGVFSGIQIAPQSFYDEGMDYCLDLLQEKGKINTLMVTPYSYYGAMGRPKEVMGDHGVEKADNRNRKLPVVWVRHDKSKFRDIGVFHAPPAEGAVYTGKDLFHELQDKLPERNMKLYLRLYEGGGLRNERISNWDKTLSVDAFGNRHHSSCFNNPYLREWWFTSIRDILENYHVDGIQFGAEEASMLTRVFRGPEKPNCFCRYCREKAGKLGIDPEKASKGSAVLYEFMEKLSKGYKPPAGVMTELMRIWMDYPEILAWEKFNNMSRNELYVRVGKEAESVQKDIEYGIHVVCRIHRSVFDRARVDFSEIAGYADFVKPILYHEIAGPRFLEYVDHYHNTVFSEFEKEEILLVMYRIFGFDPGESGDINKLKNGMGPGYVYDKTKICVNEVQDKAKVYPGIGLDIPKGESGWGTVPWHSDPESVYQATLKAFEAGASGVVASREYEEMTLESLKAYGDAVREIN